MTQITFRQATAADIPAIVALLHDDPLGQTRESSEATDYDAAFAAMAAEPHNIIVVGEIAGQIVATMQLTFISGLSRKASRRAQIEAVRVASSHRGQKIGEKLMAEAERRAIEAGCTMIQLTSDKSRTRAHEFYTRLGFTASHIGYKRFLD